jgi:hypothetical protein
MYLQEAIKCNKILKRRLWLNNFMANIDDMVINSSSYEIIETIKVLRQFRA